MFNCRRVARAAVDRECSDAMEEGGNPRVDIEEFPFGHVIDLAGAGEAKGEAVQAPGVIAGQHYPSFERYVFGTGYTQSQEQVSEGADQELTDFPGGGGICRNIHSGLVQSSDAISNLFQCVKHALLLLGGFLLGFRPPTAMCHTS